MTEKPAPHFGSLARVMLVGELAGRHVVDEQLPAGPQGGDCRVEPFPLPALGIGEDQVEAAGPAGDFQGVTGDEPDRGRPAVPRGERRGRTTSRTPLVPPVRRPAGLALAIQPTSVTPSHLWLLMPNVYDRICLVTTIYLVQHGDKERLPGDPGLTELGKRQAALTARWLRGKGLKALYSSPLRRARETAESVGAATGLAP